MAQQSAKRGDWSQGCKNCKHYESKRCTKLDISVGKRDWCDAYQKADSKE